MQQQQQKPRIRKNFANLAKERERERERERKNVCVCMGVYFVMMMAITEYFRWWWCWWWRWRRGLKWNEYPFGNIYIKNIVLPPSLAGQIYIFYLGTTRSNPTCAHSLSGLGLKWIYTQTHTHIYIHLFIHLFIHLIIHFQVRGKSNFLSLSLVFCFILCCFITNQQILLQ